MELYIIFFFPNDWEDIFPSLRSTKPFRKKIKKPSVLKGGGHESYTSFFIGDKIEKR